MRPIAIPLCTLALLLAGCGGDDATTADGSTEADAPTSGPDAAQTGCPRTPGPADHTRKVVVSRSGGAFDVFDLTTGGVLTDTGDSFTMDRAFLGEIEFTPDGEVGIAALDMGDDQGALGVFRFDQDGHPVVVHAAFDADGADGFWADRVVMAPDGAHAYVLNSQWRIHGGGIHQVAIECDGSLTYEGQVAAAKLPYAMALLSNQQRAVVAADDVLDAGVDSGNSVYLVDLGATPSVVVGVDAFGDDESIVAGAALTADGRYFLVGDNSGFYSDENMTNRVAAVEVTATGLIPTQVLAPITDPIGIVPSPDNDAVLVVSGIGDALILFGYPGTAGTPFTNLGEIDYADATGTQLASGAKMIERGTLRGRVLVSELAGIRQIQFGGDGTVTDLGVTDLGDGGTAGAIGVQP